ncbi:head-to-tail adaptor [Bacillus phage 056SW001B]|uniref:Head-to-tail adaptor n=1 Tax=Bacillus phage 056SW001B TaxID=2601663 RepID=A0A5P8PID6_9CAUD|nr:head-to-tail adaptor [Bacillus phage 056SW001B]
MAYITPSDVKKSMRNLPPTVTDEDINFHIDKAIAFLEGLLGGVFVMPLPENPPSIIKFVTIDLAVFFLAEDLYTSQMPNMDEYAQKRYDRALSVINQILDGTLSVSLPRLPDEQNASGFASTNEDEPVFTLEEPYW